MEGQLNSVVLTGLRQDGYRPGMRSLFCISIVFLMTQISAKTPATTQHDSDWNRRIGEFASAMKDGKAGAVEDLVITGCQARSFAGDETVDALKLPRRMGGSTVIATRAYETLPADLAADLAADCRKADNLPAELRRSMIPESDEQWHTARAKAASWLAAANADKGGAIGVIALLHPESPLGSETLPAFLSVIVTRGDGDSSNQRISQIAFGTP